MMSSPVWEALNNQEQSTHPKIFSSHLININTMLFNKKFNFYLKKLKS